MVVPETRGTVRDTDPAAMFADAVQILQERLWDRTGSAAARYLTHSRAIPKSIAIAYHVGYLPRMEAGAEGSYLVTALRERGHSDELMLSTGIAVRNERGSLLDKPRGGGYLALPLSDPAGAIIGIKYRAVPGEVDEDARRFDATSSALSGAMFGFDRLPEGVDTVIAVEGELDQLSLAAAREVDPSLPPAVAWHGKELSGERLALLTGKTKHVILMLDSDDGGFDGILRGGRKLARAGVGISVVRMPVGVDPNELLRAGDASGLARAVHHLPRVSLFEEHARTLTQFGPRATNIARSDPHFAASELRDTAEALAYACLNVAEVERGAALVNLDSRHFSQFVARVRDRTIAAQPQSDLEVTRAGDSSAMSLPPVRVADYDVRALLEDAIEFEPVDIDSHPGMVPGTSVGLE